MDGYDNQKCQGKHYVRSAGVGEVSQPLTNDREDQMRGKREGKIKVLFTEIITAFEGWILPGVGGKGRVLLV